MECLRHFNTFVNKRKNENTKCQRIVRCRREAVHFVFDVLLCRGFILFPNFIIVFDFADFESPRIVFLLLLFFISFVVAAAVAASNKHHPNHFSQHLKEPIYSPYARNECDTNKCLFSRMTLLYELYMEFKKKPHTQTL